MAETPTGSLPRRLLSSAASFARGRSTPQKATGVGAVALLISAPFGGLDPVAEPDLPDLKKDEPVQVGPFEVTIAGVARAREVKQLYLPAEQKNRVLAVVATVTNTSDLPEYPVTLADVVRVDGDAGLIPDEKTGEAPDPQVAVDAANSRPDIINPGVSYTLLLAWEQKGGWRGDSVDVVIDELRWIEESELTLDDKYWLDMEQPAYAGTFDVQVVE